MRSGLIILPFLSVFVFAIGLAVKSKYPSLVWVAPFNYVLSAALIIAWISWDLQNFKRFFKRKGAKFGLSSGISALLGILVIIGVAVLSARATFNASVDVTRSGSNTLSDQSLKIIAKIKQLSTEQPLTAVAYFQDQVMKSKFKDQLDLYLYEGAQISVEYLDPHKHPTRTMADKLTSANTVIFRRGDLESRIATFTEEKLTNALVKVLKNKSKKIYFTTGHGESELRTRSADSYDFVVQELENNKYGAERWHLLEKGKMPEDADLLVVAGPKYDFRAEETTFLRNYMLAGGALLVMLDAVTDMTNMASLLEEFGIKVNNDLLLLHPSDPRSVMLGQNNALVTDFDSFHSVTKDFSKSSATTMLMPNTRSLDKVETNKHKMNVELVAKTSKSIVRLKDVLDESDLSQDQNIENRLESGKSFSVIAVATGKTADKQSEETNATNDTEQADTDTASGKDATLQEENTQIRLVVVGSSHFARNQGAQSMVEHRDMFVNMTNFLLKDEDYISLRPKDITKSSITLTSSMSHLLLVLICYLYPFIFLGSGVVIWLKRRSL